jgi:N-acyl homoserine lactone hydrolase
VTAIVTFATHRLGEAWLVAFSPALDDVRQVEEHTSKIWVGNSRSQTAFTLQSSETRQQEVIMSRKKAAFERNGERGLGLRATLTAVAIVIAASSSVQAAPKAEVQLWRLDCGQIRVDDLNDFSDTYAYRGRSKRLVASCYLIKHGDTYMLWDTGLPESALGQSLEGKDAKEDALTVTIVEQLKRIGVDPAQIAIVGISHYHYDHTGQAARFAGAKLLMGRADVEELRRGDSSRAKPVDHWLHDSGKLEEVVGDKDVFEDGSVTMLYLPGHTPGHYGLLVKLARTGYVLLSGDAAHFRENYDTDGLPAWNTDRAQTLASMHRIKEIVKNLPATFVIQHEPDDVKKLPAFPESAR